MSELLAVRDLLSDLLLLSCSNYNRHYYKRQFQVPTDSSPDPEDHPFGPEDPCAVPK